MIFFFDFFISLFFKVAIGDSKKFFVGMRLRQFHVVGGQKMIER